MATKQTKIDENMRFYVQVQDTPIEAQRDFNNGRFKGTDINPMWRIKMLTQLYGPAGIGWWTEDENYTFETCEDTGETAVFCTLKLFYKDPDTGEVSKPIHGVGGNKFLVSQKSGKYCNDEAYKMAYTDAVSIACKALGFSHDIYFKNDRTKYTMAGDGMPQNESVHTTATAELIEKISAKLTEVGKGMTSATKNAFAKEVIIPIIGSVNYKSCTDVKKLEDLIAALDKRTNSAQAA